MIKDDIVIQVKHFEKLSNAVGTPLCVFDGLGHKKFYGKNKRHFRNSIRLKAGLIVKDRLRFNGIEIILEADNEDWDINHINGNKIKAFLDKNNVPHMLIITGGKGLRFHIFLEKTRAISQEHIFYIYCYLCKCIDLNWKEHGVPENKHKHHLLGCIAKIGKYGYYATCSETIPWERPKTKSQQVKFPKKIQTWDIPNDLFETAIDYGKTISIKNVSSVLRKFSYKKPMLVIK